jgi:poly-gamma-glutamate synthesis protein (capsule biosynthesis protein)
MSGRRSFLRLSAGIVVSMTVNGLPEAPYAAQKQPRAQGRTEMAGGTTLFLCGDVMLGRGIDQILQHPSDPTLYESYVQSALGYVELAEHESGRIPRHVSPSYVWGDALAELERRGADVRIINLETSVTRSDEPWPKGINYRMHPDNVGCITAAGIDCCVIANNHVLDWEQEGLAETLETLEGAHLHAVGAGLDLAAARAPAILRSSEGKRVLVFAAATGDSGVPRTWAAEEKRPGIHRLPDLSMDTVAQIAANVLRHAESGDLVVFSVHWGDNWGYEVSSEQRAFAHALIDEAGVDVVHGHSSHHVRPLEVHHERLILYGAGDFLTDYEGIRGHEEFRDELGLMYFPRLGEEGRLLELTMTPTHIRQFRVNHADASDKAWLFGTLKGLCVPYGCDIEERGDGAFALRWQKS